MSDLYGSQHLALQQSFDTARLADRVKNIIVQPEIAEEHREFIESRDLFFLTTIDHRGYPTCSYKGGPPGFVRVLDNQTIAFPSYNGNGMFLSMATSPPTTRSACCSSTLRPRTGYVCMAKRP